MPKLKPQLVSVCSYYVYLLILRIYTSLFHITFEEKPSMFKASKILINIYLEFVYV